MGLKFHVFARVFFAFTLFISIANALNGAKNFDVTKYGAVADGKTDNAKAFLAAWTDACQWAGKAKIYVPVGTFFLNEVTFSGPCKAYLTFVVKGTLVAPQDPSQIKSEAWINFRYVDRLIFTGGGTLDGQGERSWQLNDCKDNPNCKSLPMNIGFSFVRYSRIRRIKSINSKMGHFNFFSCNDVNITGVTITAPADSPNTDGIKLGSSDKIQIQRSTISTGDDCIAILSGNTNIKISTVFCGPGHGISVGSLGKYEKERDVTGLVVENCTFTGTDHGVRIKTWAASVSRIVASEFLFQDLIMVDAQNPVIIDQTYCPNGHCGQESDSEVQIRNVKYKNIRGTSASDVAVSLMCSRRFPCKDITLEDINLAYKGSGAALQSVCDHVNGDAFGKQMPPACV